MLFYWPVTQLALLGISGDWLGKLLEQKTLAVVWFTLWQAVLSTVVSVILAIPGAYLLYRRSFPGKQFVNALIIFPPKEISRMVNNTTTKAKNLCLGEMFLIISEMY